MEAVEPIRHKTSIARMKRILKARSPRDFALFTLGLNTGLRISDLLSLTVGDVLAGTGTRLRIATRLSLRERKTGKRRNVMLNSTARAAGISSRIGTHTMRKTFGYFRYTAGVPVEQLMKIFGHASPEITLAYIGITQEEIDETYADFPL